MKIYIEYEASKAAALDKRLPIRKKRGDFTRVLKFCKLYTEHYNRIIKEAMEKGDIIVTYER